MCVGGVLHRPTANSSTPGLFDWMMQGPKLNAKQPAKHTADKAHQSNQVNTGMAKRSADHMIKKEGKEQKVNL